MDYYLKGWWGLGLFFEWDLPDKICVNILEIIMKNYWIRAEMAKEQWNHVLSTIK